MSSNLESNILDNADPDLNHYNDFDVNFMAYDIDRLKGNISISDGFNLWHHNARSILKEGKLDEYELLLESINNPFHIMAFSETWLKTSNCDRASFQDFDHIYNIRPLNGEIDDKEGGGGLSLFIKTGLNYKVRYDMTLMLSFIETLFIEVLINQKKYIVGLIYRVPNENIDIFNDTLNNILEPIKNSNEVILLGDFNIDLLKDNDFSKEFRTMLQSNYLVPTILEPTRVASVNRNGETIVSETLIDNIFINRSTDFKSGLIYSSISDHYPVFTTITQCNPNTHEKSPITVKTRLIDDFRIRKFKSALQRSLLDLLNNSDDAKTSFSKFYYTFDLLYNTYFPVISKQMKQKSLLKPWVTVSLANRIKIRDKLARLANKGRINREHYTRFRNTLTAQLRNAKANYFNSEFTKYDGNIKKTWEIINSNIKKTYRNKTISLKDNDNLIKLDDVPNKFIDYFSNIASNLVSEIAPEERDASFYLKNRNLNSFFMIPIVSKEIENTINSLKSSSSIFSYSAAVLEETKSTFSNILSNIFNLCVAQGYFPEELKIGRITPIFKKGSKTLINNYRPVCNLSHFSKIFEKVIHNRMLDFINKNNILSSTQYGFRKGMGTETALIDFTDFIHQKLLKRHNVGSIFMDLSKAFDVMDHNILEKKLEHYGFRGKFLEFLMSFTRNRKYFVNVNDLSSVIKNVNIGVPQGSTLGPLFFLLFINDMKNCSKLLKFIQFADDTTLLFSSSNINHLNNILKVEGNEVIKWLNVNKLIINLTKTNCMLFSNKRDEPKISIKLNEIEIEAVQETTFLGVIIDHKLTWKPHVKHISNKISKSIAILRILRFSFPKHILRMIYMSLIFSHINYCNLIWGSAYNNTLEPLFRLQKKSVRLVNNSHYLDHSAPIFNSLKILTLQQVFQNNCLIFIYKCIKENKFPNFSNRLVRNNNIHQYNTRNNEDFRLPGGRLEIFRNAYLVQGLHLWNTLDMSIRNCSNLDTFKQNIKKICFT